MIGMKVIKRDGREVDFDKSKIVSAIRKAMCSVGTNETFLANKIATEIESLNHNLTVEEIQDIVEK